MKKGDTVYGINQSGMVGDGIVEGILEKEYMVTGYTFGNDKGHPCYELYTGPEDRTKSDSIFDYRLFDIEDVFATHEEAMKRYFIKVLAGDRMIKNAS